MRRLSIFFLVLILAVPLFAGDPFWVKKDYTDWSKDDCKKLLEKSPWSQRYDFVQVVFEPVGGTVNTPLTVESEANTGSRSPNLQINYTAQLRSALPIRQALARQVLLDPGVKDITPEQRQSLKQQADQLVAMQFPDAVVVHVIYASNTPAYDRQMANYWQHQTTETTKNLFYLIGGNGVRVQPARYIVKAGASREFELLFPRLVDGKPLLTLSDKTLVLEFYYPPVGGGAMRGQQSSRTRVGGDQQPNDQQNLQTQVAGSTSGLTKAYIPFPVKEMIQNGQVIY